MQKKPNVNLYIQNISHRDIRRLRIVSYRLHSLFTKRLSIRSVAYAFVISPFLSPSLSLSVSLFSYVSVSFSIFGRCRCRCICYYSVYHTKCSCTPYAVHPFTVYKLGQCLHTQLFVFALNFATRLSIE